jgi:hypothetical protein
MSFRGNRAAPAISAMKWCLGIRSPAASRCLSENSFVSLAVKPVGKPDAGNPHVRFDERGWETGRRFGVSARAHPRLYTSSRRYGSKPILSFTAPRCRVISLADYNVEKCRCWPSRIACCSGSPRSFRWNLRRKQPPRRCGGDDRGNARSEAVKGQSTISPLAGSLSDTAPFELPDTMAAGHKVETIRHHLLNAAWLLPLALLAQAPSPRKARPAPTGLRILSTTINPTTATLNPPTRGAVVVQVQNTTDKTVVAYALVIHEFDKDGNELNPGGAGVGIDHAEPESNPINTRNFILPGQIGSIGGYSANLETATVEASITGVVYEDCSSEGEFARMFFITRQTRAREARDEATKEQGEKKSQLEKRAAWYEAHGPVKPEQAWFGVRPVEAEQ